MPHVCFEEEGIVNRPYPCQQSIRGAEQRESTVGASVVVCKQPLGMMSFRSVQLQWLV